MASPRFQWDKKAGRFRGAGGQFVGALQVRGALDGYLAEKETWAQEWADKLARREISISEWQRGMEREIVNVHLNAAALARGGAARMDEAALKQAGDFIKSELGHLNALAVNIELGLPLDGRFRRRAGQYMQAGRANFHLADREEREQRGMNEERSIRHARDSCAECIFWEAAGWRPIGTVTVPGERECRRGCKCTLDYRLNAGLRNAKTRFTDDEDFEDEDLPKGRKPKNKTGRQKAQLRNDDPDWNDPAVHKSYGLGAPMARDPQIISPELKTHLRRFTRPREDEFGVIIDRKTGEVIDMQRGTRGQVQLNPNLLTGRGDVVPVHTHPTNAAFSGEDWDGFLLAPAVRIEAVVCPDRICMVFKTKNFDPYPPQMQGETASQYFERRRNELFSKNSWRPELAETNTRDAAAIEEVNRELAQLHGVKFKVYNE